MLKLNFHINSNIFKYDMYFSSLPQDSNGARKAYFTNSFTLGRTSARDAINQ